MSFLQTINAENALISRALLAIGIAALGVSQCAYICELVAVSNLCRPVIENAGQHVGLLFFTLPAIAFVLADILNHLTHATAGNRMLLNPIASFRQKSSPVVLEAHHV